MLILDIIGVAGIGVMAVLPVPGDDSSLPPGIESMLAFGGRETWNAGQRAALIALLAAAALLTESAVSFWLTRISLRLLAMRQYELSATLTRRFLGCPSDRCRGQIKPGNCI